MPVVDGRNSLAVVDLRTGALHRLSEPALLGSAVQAAEFRHVAVRVSDHAKVGVIGVCEVDRGGVAGGSVRVLGGHAANSRGAARDASRFGWRDGACGEVHGGTNW